MNPASVAATAAACLESSLGHACGFVFARFRWKMLPRRHNGHDERQVIRKKYFWAGPKKGP